MIDDGVHTALMKDDSVKYNGHDTFDVTDVTVVLRKLENFVGKEDIMFGSEQRKVL